MRVTPLPAVSWFSPAPRASPKTRIHFPNPPLLLPHLLTLSVLLFLVLLPAPERGAPSLPQEAAHLPVGPVEGAVQGRVSRVGGLVHSGSRPEEQPHHPGALRLHGPVHRRTARTQVLAEVREEEGPKKRSPTTGENTPRLTANSTARRMHGLGRRVIVNLSMRYSSLMSITHMDHG